MLPETREMIETAVEEAGSRSDLPDLSRSEVACYMIEQGIECWDETVETLIPDEEILKHRKVRQRERIKAKSYLDDLAGGWPGRVKSQLNARLSGEEPYPPRYIRSLADSYEEEARLYFEGEELSRMLSWLDDRITAYVEGYQAKQAVPDEMFTEVDDVSVGRDLYQLQDHGVEVIESIEQAARDGFDADAIVDRVTEAYDVGPKALMLVLDWMTEDGTNPRRALKTGEHFRTFLPDRALNSADSGPEIDADALMPGYESRDPTEHRPMDTAAEPLTLSPAEGEEVEEIASEPDPEIDPETLSDLMGGGADD
jgi:hypothetical protein